LLRVDLVLEGAAQAAVVGNSKVIIAFAHIGDSDRGVVSLSELNSNARLYFLLLLAAAAGMAARCAQNTESQTSENEDGHADDYCQAYADRH
jgi:hypothetical protein